MLDQIRNLFAGNSEAIPPSIGQQQHDLARYDVTPFAGEFDLTWLSEIEVAPVWMTRAERLLMFTMAFCLRPLAYVEIGTFQGGSALMVGSALDALQSDGTHVLRRSRTAHQPRELEQDRT